MSFKWKGLLGVNTSSPASSQSSTLTQSNTDASSSPASAIASGTQASNATPAITSPTSTVSSASAPLASTGQPAAQAVPLFGGMIPSTTHHSTSYIPPSSTTSQNSSQSRPISEIPVNLAEGGSLLLGMENFGNTCYVNSMLQSLYFCRPFRDSVLSYKVLDKEHYDSHKAAISGPPIGSVSDTSTDYADGLPPPDTLFASLRDLFDVIQQSGLQNTLSSPIRSNPPNSLPAASPISQTFPSLANGDQSTGVSRRTSILGRPTSSSTVASKVTSTPGVTANGAGATAIPIPAGSTPNSGPPNLSISTSSSGTLSPSAVDSTAVKGFIGTLKRENVLFDSTMHQDAHEMLNFVLNKVGEDLIDADRSKQKVKLQSRNPYLKSRSTSERTVNANKRVNVQDVGTDGNTCVHRLFEGVLTNETRCLTCETVTSRDECFLDLSIDIEQHSSVTSCLRQFSASEMLQSRNKFFCDSCSGLQEAEKRMKIKKLPNVLALHMKRFKYEESVQRYVKLAYRVAFPLELRLFNTSDDADDPDRLYELFAIVVHIGAGPHHGHYIAVVKVGHRWVQFDDDAVSYIDEEEIQKYYGDRPGLGSAYVLFYQAVDLDFQGLGLEEPVPAPAGPSASEIERGRMLLGVAEASALRDASSPDRSGLSANRSRMNSVTAGAANASPTVPGDLSGGSWFGAFRNRDKRSASQSLRRPREASVSDSVSNSASLGLQREGLPKADNSGMMSSVEGASTKNLSPAPGDAVGGGTSIPTPVLTPLDTIPSATYSQEATDSPSEAKYNRILAGQTDTAQEQNLLRGSMTQRLRAASEGFASSNGAGSSPDVTPSFGSGRNMVSEPLDDSAAMASSISGGADLQHSATQSPFAPLERPMSKKEQKASTKGARRISSHFVTGSSATGEKSDKKDGMLSNLFASSSSQDKSKRNSILQGSTAPSTGSVTPAEESNSSNGGHTQPSRKPSISTRSLSKTFGFGRK